MKKIILVVALLASAMLLCSCGKNEDRWVQLPNMSGTITETVITETIIEQAVEKETKYIDDEYARELEFNSRTNPW